jgi:hypothetical protein
VETLLPGTMNSGGSVGAALRAAILLKGQSEPVVDERFLGLFAQPLVQDLHAFGDGSSVASGQNGMPMIQHHHEGAKVDTGLFGIETKGRADFSGYNVINDFVTGLDTLSHKERSRPLHPSMCTQIPRVRRGT